jgi:hypothetical protein
MTMPEKVKPAQQGLCFLAYLLVSPLLVATDYYVSADGDDDNPGTFSEPFRTYAPVNGLDLEPGDSVLFRGGDTFEGTLRLTQQDEGTEAEPIVLTSYGTGRATLNGGTTQGALIQSTRHIRVENLHFIGDGRKTGNISNGLEFSNTDFIHVVDVEIEGFQEAGLSFWNCNDINVLRVIAHTNGFAGIRAANSNWNTDQGWNNNCHISHSVAYNNPGDPTILNNHSGNGIVISQFNDVLIEYCVAYENGYDMPRTGNGPVGIWVWCANRAVIQYCIAFRNRSPGKDGGGFDLDGGTRNSVIQYCLSYDNEGPGYGFFQFSGAPPWFNNVVRYCISIHDGSRNNQAGLAIWDMDYDADNFRDFVVHNNTFINRHYGAIDFIDARLKNFLISNNIFISKVGPYKGSPQSVIYDSNHRMLYNHYEDLDGGFNQSGFSDFAAWAANYDRERFDGQLVGTTGDSQLLDQSVSPTLSDPMGLLDLAFLRPQAGSPVIDSAIDLLTAFGIDPGTRDLAGTPIPFNGSYDRGALEMGCGHFPGSSTFPDCWLEMIAELEPTSGELILNLLWQSQMGQLYRVEAAPDPSGPWTPYLENIAADPPTNAEAVAVPESLQFFKVIGERAP